MFKTSKYVIYKLINNLISLLFLKAGPPLIYTRNLNLGKLKQIKIDISHSTTHLGDQLFLIPLVRFLMDKKVDVEIVDDGLFKNLYQDVTGCVLSEKLVSSTSPVLILKPSFLEKRKKYSKLIVVDFTDTRSTSKISLKLIESLSLLFEINFYKYKFVANALQSTLVNKVPLDSSSKYIIFNNYIDSGKFRTLFLDIEKLKNQCINYKKHGYKIIHVGSAKDKDFDGVIYDFVDIDLRGMLSIHDLICLIFCREIISVVTFDNFIMHIAHIFGKSTHVLFRGRFTQSQFKHHMKSVNNTFLLENKTITYL